jgi:hypothetical protein
MDVFTFVILIILITTLGKAGVAIAAPLGRHLGDLLKEMSAERKASRQALETGVRLDSVVVEELETRLARIEERLDFVEQLRKPDPLAGLPAGDPSVSPPER